MVNQTLYSLLVFTHGKENTPGVSGTEKGGEFMEAVKAKELAKAFVRGFYLQGNLYGLINADTTDPNLIGFATQSAQYARGRRPWRAPLP